MRGSTGISLGIEPLGLGGGSRGGDGVGWRSRAAAAQRSGLPLKVEGCHCWRSRWRHLKVGKGNLIKLVIAETLEAIALKKSAGSSLRLGHEFSS